MTLTELQTLIVDAIFAAVHCAFNGANPAFSVTGLADAFLLLPGGLRQSAHHADDCFRHCFPPRLAPRRTAAARSAMNRVADVWVVSTSAILANDFDLGYLRRATRTINRIGCESINEPRAGGTRHLRHVLNTRAADIKFSCDAARLIATFANNQTPSTFRHMF